MGAGYNIVLKKDALPVVHPPRRVPLALQGKLKQTLNDLANKKVITPVVTPTDWVSSLVITEKKNKELRL